MKKNYSEPRIKVQAIALQQVIALSITDEPTKVFDTKDRSDVLDDWKWN